jgi:EmrB/QacA subfamily drug resistance transporter
MAQTSATAATTAPVPRDHRWFLLATVALAQLMVVLDATIVNIALPDAQRSLGFSDADRQWVITAYALAFGSLLLLGGRIGDLFGRKRVFITGLIGFAVASAVGGASTSFGMLVTARAAQGLFGALLAPAALSLLTVTFTDPGERGKAFGVFGAVAGGGSAVGLVLGGLLTEELSWRWCLYVNLIFAAIAVVGAVLFVHDREDTGGTLDLVGTVLASLGLFGVVYGFAHAQPPSATAGARWGSPVTIVALAGGAVLLVAFVLSQRRVRSPLLPLRVVLDRTRGGSYLAVGISGIAIFGVFLFLTYYLQEIAHYSPLVNGVAFLPLTAAIIMSSTLSNIRLLPRFGPRILVFGGMLLGSLGMILLVRLPLHMSYAADILPSLLILGIGFGLIFAPAINTATAGVEPHDAGVASAMVNTMQQVSGSIGTALLSTIVGTAVARYAGAHARAGLSATALGNTASLHAYHIAFVISSFVFLGGAVICGSLVRSKADQERVAPLVQQELVAAH